MHKQNIHIMSCDLQGTLVCTGMSTILQACPELLQGTTVEYTYVSLSTTKIRGSDSLLAIS